MGKILVVVGLVVAGLGLVIWMLGRLGFRGLPGDVRYESDHVKVYFPIVTCIVLSAILTGLLWLAAFIRNWWNR